MDINVQTFNKICRICLIECADMKSLFTKTDGEERNLFEILAFTANINVKVEDGLPKQVCGECESVMCKADAFKRRCLDSETILNYAYQKSVSNTQPSNIGEKFSIKDEQGDVEQKINKYDSFQPPNVTNSDSHDSLDIKDDLLQEPPFFATAATSFCKLTDSKVPENYQQSVKEEVINNFEEEIDFSDHYNDGSQCEILPVIYDEENPVKSEGTPCTCCCGLTFSDKNKYETHLKKQHCLKYKKIFEKLKQNELITIKNKIECHDCNFKFNTPQDWSIHQRTQHNRNEVPDTYDCNFCSSKFKSKTYLELHVKKHEKTVNTTTELYQCSLCQRKFKNKTALSAHIKKHEKWDKIKYVCEVCKREFKYKAYLENHILTLHSKNNGITCDICGQHFSNKKSLELHKESHQNEKKHRCTVCNKGFLMSCTLKEHMRIHTGEKPFLCSQCGRGFSQKTNLAQHMRRHQGLKPFKCKECEKGFVSKGELDAHNRKHSGAHPFVCDDCGNGFTTSSALVKHRRIHTGEKPYLCDLCPRKFAASGTLKNHRRTHTGERPFQCSYCEKAFTQRNDLISHIRCHTGEKPYVCNQCGQSFRKAAGLKTHVKMHVKEPVNAGHGVNVMVNGMQCAEQ